MTSGPFINLLPKSLERCGVVYISLLVKTRITGSRQKVSEVSRINPSTRTFLFVDRDSHPPVDVVSDIHDPTAAPKSQSTGRSSMSTGDPSLGGPPTDGFTFNLRVMCRYVTNDNVTNSRGNLQ